MALPQSRFNMAAAAKKKTEPELDDEAKRRAIRKRATLKSMKSSPEEDVVDKRKQVTY